MPRIPKPLPGQPTNLFVIDDSKSDKSDVSALVGVLIPIEKADGIRLSVNRFLRELEGVAYDELTLPPELHACEMLSPRRVPLPWATDVHRLRCFDFVIDLVNAHRLEILRSAFIRDTLDDAMKRDALGLCFFNLQLMLKPTLEKSFVIPMLDGFGDAATIGASARYTHVHRAAPFFREQQISVKNAHNLMDPVFLDSKHSPLMQIADVATYSLQILDYDRLGLPFNAPYIQGVLAASKRLDLTLVRGAEPIAWGDMKPV